jgi:DNA-binding protein H-NS
VSTVSTWSTGLRVPKRQDHLQKLNDDYQKLPNRDADVARLFQTFTQNAQRQTDVRCVVAQEVIASYGGPRAMAFALDIPESAVFAWNTRRTIPKQAQYLKKLNDAYQKLPNRDAVIADEFQLMMQVAQQRQQQRQQRQQRQQDDPRGVMAQAVIKAYGGVKGVAETLDIPVPTVSGWAEGVLPSRQEHLQKLVDAYQQLSGGNPYVAQQFPQISTQSAHQQADDQQRQQLHDLRTFAPAAGTLGSPQPISSRIIQPQLQPEQVSSYSSLAGAVRPNTASRPPTHQPQQRQPWQVNSIIQQPQPWQVSSYSSLTGAVPSAPTSQTDARRAEVFSERTAVADERQRNHDGQGWTARESGAAALSR